MPNPSIPGRWSDNDRFWEATFPFEFDETRFAAASHEVTGLLGLVEVPDDGVVLEMCCGPGRHALELALRGYSVTGVDRTTSYIDIARSRAASAGAAIEYIVADATSFERQSHFDLILNLFTSFGYFDRHSENVAVLSRARQSLRPGGQLVIETISRPAVMRVPQATDRLEKNGSVLEESSTVSPDRTTLTGNWTLRHPSGLTEAFTFRLNLYSAQSLTKLLRQAGFTTLRFFDGFSGNPYTDDSVRMLVVARF